jgi:uncharacterized protein (DUF488 family)
MYYRQKLLLALLEVFDGSLKRTDCEKLLFNFCQMTGKNHYDFFPYQYGPFSFLSYYDKRRLTELGLLKSTDDFDLKTSHSYVKEVTPSDKAALLKLKASGLSGRNLIRKIYREHPQFAVRSKIATTLFDEEEIKQIQFAWNIDQKPCIFSLGYEGLTIDSFLNKLIANNVMAVVDVRNNPQSMKYGFSKKSFGYYIEKAEMKYFHIPELGIPSAMRKGLGQSVSYESLFRKYEADLLPDQGEAKTHLSNLIVAYPRIALVCFEADHHYCHRYTLIEHIQKERKILRPVIHL